MSHQTERVIELALEEARRSLTYQAGTVDELRSRTGQLLAAASIAVSFLGSSAAAAGRLGWYGALALAAFLVTVGSCLRVLWPRTWTFVTSSKTLLEDWAEVDRDEDVRSFLAKSLEGHYETNRIQTKRLMRWYQLAACSVGATVILGGVELATRSQVT
ncbi:MAG: hypothetical protein U0R24_06680 [Solirubrobacterales bacterium]